MNDSILALMSGLVAFVIVFLTALAALKINGIWAAVLYSLPLTMLPTIGAFYFTKKPSSKSSHLLYSSIITMVALIIFLTIWAVSISYLYNNNRQKKYWVGFVYALLGWLMFNSILIIVSYSCPKIRHALF